MLLALHQCAATRKVPDTITEFEPEKYMGRWYQVYGNIVSDFTSGGFSGKLRCNTADYKLLPNGTILVKNYGMDKKGRVHSITGEASIPDPKKPGQLTVDFYHKWADILAAPYWIVALGPIRYSNNGHQYYQWAIITDPLKAFLYVIARDPEEFKVQFDDAVRLKLNELGFTKIYNKPRAINQKDCTYQPLPWVEETDDATLDRPSSEILEKPSEVEDQSSDVVDPSPDVVEDPEIVM